MTELLEKDKLTIYISQVLEARRVADADFVKNVEQASKIRKKATLAHEEKVTDIINTHKKTALEIAVYKNRYISDDVGLPTNPDRIFVTIEGIRLEWDYEDRGYTETMSSISSWDEIFDERNQT